VAEYNVDIQVRAKTQQVESQLTKLQQQLDRLSTAANNIDFRTPERSIRNLGNVARSVGNEIRSIFSRGLFAGATLGAAQLPNAFSAITAKLGPLQGAVNAAGSAFDSALGGVPHLVGNILTQLGHIPNSFGIAAVAAMAFAPQLLKASSAAVGLGAAVDKAVGTQTTKKIAEVITGLNGVEQSLNATQAAFADLIQGSTLNQLNKQLADANKQIGEYHSSTEEARVAAQQLVSVLRAQATEQRAINDLVRQAKGITQSELQEAKAIKFLETRRRQQEYLNKEADKYNREIDEYNRLAQEAAAVTKEWERSLQAVDKSARAAVLGSSSQIQARLQEMRENRRSVEIAREQSLRLAQETAYGPQGAMPLGVVGAATQTTRIAANRAAADAVAAENRAYAEGAKQRIEWERKVNQISTSLQKEINSVRVQHNAALYRLEQRRVQRIADEQRKADQETQRRRAQRTENLALGAGFPLLFGGGPGAILGGVAGGLMPGKGFGAQILLSALGQVFDQAAQEARDFAIALRTTGDGTQYLEQRLGTLDPRIKAFITNLSESGQTAEAAEMSVNVLSDAIGEEYANALVKAGKTTETFSNNAGRFFTGLQARVAVLINAFNDFGAAYDRLLGISSTSVSDLVLAEPPQETLGQQQVRRRVEDLQAEGKVQQLQLDLATAIAGKNEQSEFIIQRKLLLQRAINEAAAIERDLEDKKITAQEKSIALSNIDKKLQTDLLKLLTDQTKKQQDRAKEAERLAREEQQNTNRRLGYQSQILQGLAQEYGIQTQGVDVVYGAISGYETKLRLAAKTAVVQEEALRLERDAALNTEEGARNQDLINTLYDNRIEKLRQETSFNENNLRLLKDRAILEERLATLEQTKGFGRQLREIDRLSTQGMSQEDIFMRGLKARRESYVEPLLDRAQQLSEQIMSGTLSRDALKATNDELNRTELQLANVIDRLDVLDKQDIVWEKNRFQVELLSNTLNSVGQQVSSVFEALIMGTDNWNQTLAGVFNSLARIAFNFGLSSLAGDDGKGFFSFLTGSLKPRALGGPVSAGSSYLVGERGPEMFVPRTSGSIYPNDAMGIGGGNITVNVDATGTSVQGNGDDSKRLGEAIGVAIRQELIKQKRPGGLLA
jgi:hypothetical protein